MIQMAPILLASLLMAISVTISSSADLPASTISTSEGHIKQIMTDLFSRCPDNCKETASDIKSRTEKNDICKAVRSYRLCTLLPCHSVSASDELEDAIEICDGSSVVQVSIYSLLLASIVHLYKITCI